MAYCSEMNCLISCNPALRKSSRLKGTIQQRLEEPERLVKEVLEAHKDVRFAGLFDVRGRKITASMKKGSRSLDPPKKASQVDRDTALYPAMLASNERYFGRFGYMFVKMERVNAMTFQVGKESFLVVTTDPPTGLDVVPKIQDIIDRY